MFLACFSWYFNISFYFNNQDGRAKTKLRSATFEKIKNKEEIFLPPSHTLQHSPGRSFGLGHSNIGHTILSHITWPLSHKQTSHGLGLKTSWGLKTWPWYLHPPDGTSLPDESF